MSPAEELRVGRRTLEVKRADKKLAPEDGIAKADGEERPLRADAVFVSHPVMGEESMRSRVRFCHALSTVDVWPVQGLGCGLPAAPADRSAGTGRAYAWRRPHGRSAGDPQAAKRHCYRRRS